MAKSKSKKKNRNNLAKQKAHVAANAGSGSSEGGERLDVEAAVVEAVSSPENLDDGGTQAAPFQAQAEASAEASDGDDATGAGTDDAIVSEIFAAEASADGTDTSGDNDAAAEAWGEDDPVLCEVAAAEEAERARLQEESLAASEQEGLVEAEGGQLLELPLGAPDVIDEETLRLMSVFESVLFAADKALSAGDLKRIVELESDKTLKVVLDRLDKKHADSGLRIILTAGGYRMQTAPENDRFVLKLVQGRPVRLSRALMETLAIVCYRQPITRPEIDDVRGVDTGPVLKTLLDRNLIRVIGKKEEVGRPLLYGTTPEFLRVFNLKDLTDLPTLREFHELGQDEQAKVEDAHGPFAGAPEQQELMPPAASAVPEGGTGEAADAPSREEVQSGIPTMGAFTRSGAVGDDRPDDEADALLDELEQATVAVSRALRDSRRDVEPGDEDKGIN